MDESINLVAFWGGNTIVLIFVTDPIREPFAEY